MTSNPFPSLPFGTERQRPGQWSPGMDPAGQMWAGPDPTKPNLGIPMRSAVYSLDNPYHIPMDAALGDNARFACMQSITINANFREALCFMAELSFPTNAKQWRAYAKLANNDKVLFVRPCCN